MRVFGIILIVLISFSCDTENSFPVPEENYFVKFYGEEGDQEGIDFIVNSDGSVVMVGNTQRPGVKKQIYVVKVDGNGQVLWQRRMGLPDKEDFAKDIELHPDGRIVIAGETEMGANNRDVYIKTLSQEGAPLDSTRAGLKLSNGSDADEETNSVTVISAGSTLESGFIIAGSTTAVLTPSGQPNNTKDGLHFRFTNSLRLLDKDLDAYESKKQGNDSEDIIYKVIQKGPNEYYGFGYTNRLRKNSRDFKFWTISFNDVGSPSNEGVDLLDTLGNTLESEILSSTVEIPIQSGRGFVLSGVAKGLAGELRVYIAKIDNPMTFLKSDLILQKYPLNLGVNLSSNLESVTLNILSNGKFLLTASNYQTDNPDIILVKLNSNMDIEWGPFIFGSEGNDFAGSVAELPDGRILLVGTMTIGGGNDKGQKKMVLIKLNPEGKLTE